MTTPNRLNFGGAKYAAFNLMVARWLRTWQPPLTAIQYVTMGGTEMLDVLHFYWANQPHLASVVSYEEKADRYSLAIETADRLGSDKISIKVILGDMFDYRRENDLPHVFFVDLTGHCGIPYRDPFRLWFQDNVIRTGDFLMVTSYLGRNPGWRRVLSPFMSEFGMLGLESEADQKVAYERLHPAFILNRALIRAQLSDEVKIDCIGHIRYRDTSPMGIYGFVCKDGETELSKLVSGVPLFNTITKEISDMISA